MTYPRKTYVLLFVVVMLGCNNQQEENTTSTLKYTLTINATWSMVTHPLEFPENAHFSRMIGMVHSEKTELFFSGKVATKGMADFSKYALLENISDEIYQKIKDGTAKKAILAPAIIYSPNTNVVEILVENDPEHSLISIASKIAPGPDWFVAIRNISLYENGAWVESKNVPFEVFDAGVNANNTFSNDLIEEDNPILILTTPPLATDGTVSSMGTVSISKKE